MLEKSKGGNCWDFEPSLTPCTNIFNSAINMKDKKVYCKKCLFYGYANKSENGKMVFKVHL